MSKLLVLIKPWAVEDLGELLRGLDTAGKRVSSVISFAPRNLLEQHYSDHKGRPYYEEVVEDMSNGPLIANIYEGDVKTMRKKGLELREKFTYVTPKEINLSGKYTRNALHISSDEDEAERDLFVWKDFFVIS